MATTRASSEDADITEQQRRYNDFVALLQPRTPTFRQNERDALVELVCEYFNVEKNGKLVRLTFRKDNKRVPSSKVAWQEIAARFNSNPTFSKRAVQQLRKCWMNMRTRDNFTPGQRLRLGLDQTGKKRRTINSKLRSLSGQIPQIRITKINTGTGVPQIGSIRSRQQQYRRRPPSRAGRPTVSRGPQKVERHQTVTHVYDLTEGVNVPSRQDLVAGGRTDQNHRFVQNRPTACALDHVRHEQQVHKVSRGATMGGLQDVSVTSRRSPVSSGQDFRGQQQVVPVRMFRNTNSTVSNPNLGALRQTEPNVCPSSFASQRPTTVHHRGDYHDTAISSQADVVPGVHAIHESDMEYPIQIGVLPTEVSNDFTGADSSAIDGRHDPNSGTGLLNELLLAPVESGPVILSVTSIPGSGPEEDAPMDDITSDMDEVEIVIKSEDNDETSVTAVPLPRSSQEMFQQTQESISGDQLVRRVNSNQAAVAQGRQGTIRTSVSEGSQRTSNHADRASHARDSGQQAMSSGSQQRRTDDGIQRQQGHRVASEEQRVIDANSSHVGQNDVSRESRSGNDGRSGQINSKRKESSTKSKATGSDSAPEANNPHASGSIGAGRGRDRGHSEKLHSSLAEEKKARLDILRYQAMKAREEAEQARCRRELLEVELASAKQQMELSRLRQEAEIELIRQQVRQEKAKADKMTASQASSSNS